MVFVLESDIRSAIELREKLAEKSMKITKLKLWNCNIKLMHNIFPKNQLQIVNLSLTNCGIEKLSKNTFHGLEALEKLYLSYNKLKNLHEQLLIKNRKLILVFFDNNQLQKIPQKLFQNNRKLSHLVLKNNKLKTFSKQMLENLKNLNIYNNCLIKFDSNYFPKLEELNLSCNNLKHLRSNVFAMIPNLITLSLRENQISNLNYDVFYFLNKLEYLYLDGNRLQILKENLLFNKKHLKILSLANNNLSHFEKQMFSECKQLEFLCLNQNKFETLDWSVFQNLENFQNLHCENNHIQKFENSVKTVIFLQIIRLVNNQSNLILRATNFQHFPYLEELILKNAKIIALEQQVFDSLHCLKKLDLSENCLKTLPIALLPAHVPILTLKLSLNQIEICRKSNFRSETILKSLDLSANTKLAIASNAFENIANHLSELILTNISFENQKLPFLSYLRNLTKLNLSVNLFHTIPKDYFWSFKNLKQLILKIAENSICNQTNNLDHTMFSEMNVLEFLDLAKSKIVLIADNVFANLLHLTTLYLNENCLCSLEEKLFVELVNLRYLNLNFNPLGNFQVNHFENNSQLTELHLRTNTMTYLKAEHLNLTSLKILSLNGTCDCDMEIFNLPTLKINFGYCWIVDENN